jgi:hypothetical protein
MAFLAFELMPVVESNWFDSGGRDLKSAIAATPDSGHHGLYFHRADRFEVRRLASMSF